MGAAFGHWGEKDGRGGRRVSGGGRREGKRKKESCTFIIVFSFDKENKRKFSVMVLGVDFGEGELQSISCFVFICFILFSL